MRGGDRPVIHSMAGLSPQWGLPRFVALCPECGADTVLASTHAALRNPARFIPCRACAFFLDWRLFVRCGRTGEPLPDPLPRPPVDPFA